MKDLTYLNAVREAGSLSSEINVGKQLFKYGRQTTKDFV